MNTALLLIITFIISLILARLISGKYGKQVTHWLNIPIWYVIVMEIPQFYFIKALAFYFAVHFLVRAMIALMDFWSDDSNKINKESYEFK